MRIFKAPDESKITSLYKVRVNGEEIPVFRCEVKAKQFATGNVDSKYDTYEQKDEEAGFIIIDKKAEETLSFEIMPSFGFDELKVRPQSKNIRHSCTNGVIKLEYGSFGQFTVEPGSHHNALHVFVNNEDDYKDVDVNDPSVKYFGPGLHNANRIRVNKGDTVFIDFGAWVSGSFYEENVDDFRIIGHGILDRAEHYDVPVVGGVTSLAMTMHFLGCNNVKIDGITMMNAPMWVICINNCNGFDVNNVKEVGMWMGSTDGFDIVNSQNVSLTDSFLRNGDDCVTIKGFAPFNCQNNENITVKGCIFWCDWGVALQIGAEACAEHYRNIYFKDCDIIHEAQAAISFQTGGYADVHDIFYEDIRVEYSKHARKPLLYIGNDMKTMATEVYGHKKIERDSGITPAINPGDVSVKKKYVDELFDTIEAPKSMLKDVDYCPPDEPFLCWLIHIEICEHWHDILAPDYPFANNHAITFKNINVIADEGLGMPPSKVKGLSDISRTYDVRLSDIYFNGKKLKSLEEANFVCGEYSDDVRMV